MYDNDPKHIANVIIAYLDNVTVKKACQRGQAILKNKGGHVK